MAKLKKIQKNFRLSFESIAFLEAIANKSDINETQVLEMAISDFASKKLSIEEREDILVKKFRETLALGKEEK